MKIIRYGIYRIVNSTYVKGFQIMFVAVCINTPHVMMIKPELIADFMLRFNNQ